MRWLLCLKLTCLILLAGNASANDLYRRDPVLRSHSPRASWSYPNGGALNVRVYDGGSNGIVFHNPGNGIPVKKNPCFPYSCEGIGEEITNPHPRKESEIPACYYGVDDVLFFEKEGSNCSYIRPKSSNTARIEKRRQEHLTKEAVKP